MMSHIVSAVTEKRGMNGSGCLVKDTIAHEVWPPTFIVVLCCLFKPFQKQKYTQKVCFCGDSKFCSVDAEN